MTQLDEWMSENFSLSDATYSEKALKYAIDNTPNLAQFLNMQRLCVNVLELVREHYRTPIKTSSFYRSPELCLKIGSKVTSQHCANDGAAADFEIKGVDNKDLAIWISANLIFDQLILEKYERDGDDPGSGWVHCSYRPAGNRNQRLITDDGKSYTAWKTSNEPF